MPAGAQDAWDKRVVADRASPSRAGCARSKSARARVKGRKITHHAIALSPADRDRSAARPIDADGLPQRRPFMEWAVGKQGEMMRPDTGKLLLPGSKIHWDIHYSQAGEEITRQGRDGHLLLPEGPGAEVPHVLLSLRRRPALGTLDIRRTRSTSTEGFTCCARTRRIESFQPHMHLRGKAMMVEAILPNGQKQVISLVSDFNFNWMTTYVYADDVGAAAAEGHDPQGHGVARQHRRQEGNPDPNSGSAGAIARSTKWRTPGSTSST